MPDLSSLISANAKLLMPQEGQPSLISLMKKTERDENTQEKWQHEGVVRSANSIKDIFQSKPFPKQVAYRKLLDAKPEIRQIFEAAGEDYDAVLTPIEVPEEDMVAEESKEQRVKASGKLATANIEGEIKQKELEQDVLRQKSEAGKAMAQLAIEKEKQSLRAREEVNLEFAKNKEKEVAEAEYQGAEPLYYQAMMDLSKVAAENRRAGKPFTLGTIMKDANSTAFGATGNTMQKFFKDYHSFGNQEKKEEDQTVFIGATKILSKVEKLEDLKPEDRQTLAKALKYLETNSAEGTKGSPYLPLLRLSIANPEDEKKKGGFLKGFISMLSLGAAIDVPNKRSNI